jgi:hypothetical protein
MLQFQLFLSQKWSMYTYVLGWIGYTISMDRCLDLPDVKLL